jgi:hypothetical protein
MLKRLAIFAIAAFMAICVSGQPDKAPDPNQQIGKTEPVHSLAAQTPPKEKDKPAAYKDATSSGPPAGNASVERPHWWCSSEWWLVIVGFGTLIVVGWQTKILGKSVAVAKKSAEATEKQVDLFVNAERAKITMYIVDSGRSFYIRGKNTGKAVAQVKLAVGYSLVLPRGKPLPAVPPYLSEPDTLRDFLESVPPNESIAPMDGSGNDFMMNLRDPDLCAAIRDKQKTLWTYGRIVYMDGISSHQRETRFCYEAAVDAKLETNIDMSGPGVYRLET